MGLIETVAGEDGLGWNARLLMIEAGFRTDGSKGFVTPVGKYLVQRYDSARVVKQGESHDRLRQRCAEQLTALDKHLAIRGGDYFGGAAPNALDVYTAAFLVPLDDLDETKCPNIVPFARQGFAAAAEALAPLVPNSLIALRERMFQKHLGWPLEI
jgi:glutathione S-transferase